MKFTKTTAVSALAAVTLGIVVAVPNRQYYHNKDALKVIESKGVDNSASPPIPMTSAPNPSQSVVYATEEEEETVYEDTQPVTAYATKSTTIFSCAESVTNCPLRSATVPLVPSSPVPVSTITPGGESQPVSIASYTVPTSSIQSHEADAASSTEENAPYKASTSTPIIGTATSTSITSSPTPIIGTATSTSIVEPTSVPSYHDKPSETEKSSLPHPSGGDLPSYTYSPNPPMHQSTSIYGPSITTVPSDAPSNYASLKKKSAMYYSLQNPTAI